MAGFMDLIGQVRDFGMDASTYYPQGGVIPAYAWGNERFRPDPGLVFADAVMRGFQGAKASQDRKAREAKEDKRWNMMYQLQADQNNRANQQQYQGLMDMEHKRNQGSRDAAMWANALGRPELVNFGSNRDATAIMKMTPSAGAMKGVAEMNQPAKLAPGVQEFVDVVGRAPQSAEEYVAFHQGKKGPGTTVNVNGDPVDTRPIVNKPAAGYQRRWDEEGQTWVDEPIKGSEPASEKETRAKTRGKAGAIAVRELDLVLDMLGADRDTGKLTGKSQVVGPKGRVLAGSQIGDFVMAGTKTGDFMGTVQSIKDTIAIERLLEIKASGAGLGQVPQSQLEALARALGNLNPNASDELLARNLADVRRIYSNVVENSINDANDDTFSGVLRDVIEKPDGVDLIYNPQTGGFE